VVAVHEFGHVLGLDHEQRRCAVMNPLTQLQCEEPADEHYRCRVLEADDLKGAVRGYGGRARLRTPAECRLYGGPGAVTGLTVAADGQSVSFTAPPRPQPVVPKKDILPPEHRLELTRAPGVCPADLTALFAVPPPSDSLRDNEWGRSVDWRLFGGLEPGTWCIAVRLVDAFGAAGPVVTTEFVVPPYTD
jgi:hypothetical protein